jgi:uncharacterized protein (TIGR00730 family)
MTPRSNERAIAAIAVFCGSNPGTSDAYARSARALGRALGRDGITLVYGGTIRGLMGIVADAALETGGTVHGIVTEGLHARGQSHTRLTRHEIAPSLRRRQERMVDVADAFVALPGGVGTVAELMEAWAMNQLGEIDKPVGLLNPDGFFDGFLGFISHMVATGFLPPAHRDSICVDPDPVALVRRLRGHSPVDVPKWL